MNRIFGIGTDIVSNQRMMKILQGTTRERFLNKVLNKIEIEEFNQKSTEEQKTQYLASRWAFKEAIVKASGRRELIFPQMYLVKSLDCPKPRLKIEETSKQILEEQLQIKDIHVSISHENEFSVAFVILTL
ncbi:hypothetical protein ABPG72_004158 [Tetrahymena utriculariae]